MKLTATVTGSDRNTANHCPSRVLLPSEPNPDLCQLLASAGIGATWPGPDGWRSVDASAPTSHGALSLDAGTARAMRADAGPVPPI